MPEWQQIFPHGLYPQKPYDRFTPESFIQCCDGWTTWRDTRDATSDENQVDVYEQFSSTRLLMSDNGIARDYLLSQLKDNYLQELLLLKQRKMLAEELRDLREAPELHPLVK